MERLGPLRRSGFLYVLEGELKLTAAGRETRSWLPAGFAFLPQGRRAVRANRNSRVP